MEVLDTVTLRFDQQSLQLMNACLALVMFGVAVDLTLADFRRLFVQPRTVLVGLASQIILLPALTLLLVYFLDTTTSVALGMLLVATCPGGNLSNLLTLIAKGNGALSVSLTALATLLAVVTVPLNFTIWTNIYGQTAAELPQIVLPVGPLLTTLVGVVGVPLLLGVVVNERFPSLARRIRRPLRIISIAIFLVFIGAALATNFDLFLQHIHLLFMLVLAHNALAYTGGYLMSTIFRLTVADRTAITLETGIQNSGLALVIIFNFFDGWGGMAFVAGWWGIWDMISGLLLAWGLAKTKGKVVLSRRDIS